MAAPRSHHPRALAPLAFRFGRIQGAGAAARAARLAARDGQLAVHAAHRLVERQGNRRVKVGTRLGTKNGARVLTLREHFRRTFQNASVRLAELYTDNSAPDAAVELYRELSEIDPVDEKLWFALFRLHAERGDHPALRREERRMRELLRTLAEDEDASGSQDALEPSRELTDEFQRLLASLPDREREPAAV